MLIGKKSRFAAGLLRSCMGSSHRYITSLLLTIIYLLIVFSPLAPLAMQSKLVAHAVTGECSGDCRIDGCSLERSAAHTCCCWQKKRREAPASHGLSQSDMRDTPPPLSAEVPTQRTGCCPAVVQDSHENEAEPISASSTSPQKERATTVSSSPCGSGKLFGLSMGDKTQHLPYFFTGVIPSPEQSHLTCIPPDRLTSRYGDPPDPPPIISYVS